MANSYAGTAATNAANEALVVFKTALGPLVNLFSTNFSADSFNGTAVTTRLVPAGGSAAAKSTTSYVDLAADVTTTLKTVTLNQHYVNGYKLTLKEMASMSPGVLMNLEMALTRQHVNAMAKNVLDYLFALVTAGNYTSAHNPIAAAAYDYQDVIDHRTTLAAANWPIAQTNQVLSSGHLGALLKDSQVSSLADSGLSAVVDGAGAIKRIGGMATYEAVQLPTTGNLAGFHCTPSCIAMAMRPPSPANAELPSDVMVDTVADADTGISISAYRHFDRTQAQWIQNFECWYGASVGDPSALYRIVSA